MTFVTLVETLILAAATITAIRNARKAEPPYGLRLLWIALLLVLQLGAFYGFIAIHYRTGWGGTHASPPGVAILTQLVRVALLLVAMRAWLGIVGDEVSKAWQRLALILCFVAFGWGGGSLPLMAAVALIIVFNRTKWYEALTGWRRAVGFVVATMLLLALSFLPYTSVHDGKSNSLYMLAPRPWPPALLFDEVAARAELALARPLDRLIQAITDLLRVQLFVLATKFLFLPIRLSGMSLKRRFWFNFVLVRSIPSLLTTLVMMGIVYLGLGYTKSVRVRSALEQTMARAATVANALGDEPLLERTTDRSRLDLARAWMAPDSTGAFVVARGPDSTAHATSGTPTAILDPPLSRIDTTTTRGLYLRGDAIYLAVVRRSERVSLEVWTRIDSSYLARTMRDIGGSARLTARPHVFVGGAGLRVDGDTSWTARAVTARYVEPVEIAGTHRLWFLSRLFFPVGSWLQPPGSTWRGAIELYLESTPRSLLRSSIRSLGGLYSNLFLLLILAALGAIVGMVESFAVRSGKSILQAVHDEIGTLRKAATEFGRGNLEYRLPVKGKDEISIVATSFNDMAANLGRQRQELIAAERIEEDLAVAREIQQRFLPQQAPGLPGLDVAGVSIPSKEVGGDLFYWFTHDDGSLGFVLGDVSGKSVPAALLMSNVLSTLRAQAIERAELAASLERTNRLIIDQIEPGRFVTLFYGEADPARGTLSYVSAGHNPPLMLRVNGELEWLREGGVPLGVLPTAAYRTTIVPFGIGDTLIVYSDGVTEAEGANRAALAPGGKPEPQLFGDDRLATVVRGLRGRPAREVLERVLDAVRQFAAGVEQADDVTIVVVRRV